MNKISEVRPSPIAGYWYSSNPRVLKAEINDYLNQAILPEINGEIIGLFAPHAGYRYSGPTAGYAYKAIQDQEYELVIILSPYHAYHPASILSSSHQYYETPFGRVKVDQSILNSMMEKISLETSLEMVLVANDEEHSLEIELPFLQLSVNNSFSILPLMIRSINPQEAGDVATIILNLVKDKKVLVVASTDLSHFYSEAVAESLDAEMLKQIQTFSIENVFRSESNGTGFACGLGAVMVCMSICDGLGADKIEILHHSTSGKMTGDFSSVVGYGAGVFIRTNE